VAVGDNMREREREETDRGSEETRETDLNPKF
jgi:hypothetical protein